MILIVTQGSDLIAQDDNYDGPVPRVGEYIFHPEFDDDGTSAMSLPSAQIAGCVKTVTYGIYTRPKNGEKHFVGRPVKVVQVTI
jgi:hypothetical protein